MSFSSSPMNPKWFEPASKFVSLSFPAAVAKLGQLVKIPGVAWPSFDPVNLEISAEKVADEFRQLGFLTSSKFEEPQCHPGT